MQPEIQEFNTLLRAKGLHAALQYLNSRTPHRYTGVFRFDGETLRNEALFDRYEPNVHRGEDVPMAVTYCSLVGRQQTPLEIQDAAIDLRVQEIETPVVSYCGVPIRDASGIPIGTLCHYDMQRCQERTADLPLLEAAAEMLRRRVAAR